MRVERAFELKQPLNQKIIRGLRQGTVAGNSLWILASTMTVLETAFLAFASSPLCLSHGQFGLFWPRSWWVAFLFFRGSHHQKNVLMHASIQPRPHHLDLWLAFSLNIKRISSSQFFLYFSPVFILVFLLIFPLRDRNRGWAFLDCGQVFAQLVLITNQTRAHG